jgi:hypothetical protein
MRPEVSESQQAARLEALVRALRLQLRRVRLLADQAHRELNEYASEQESGWRLAA